MYRLFMHRRNGPKTFLCYLLFAWILAPIFSLIKYVTLWQSGVLAAGQTINEMISPFFTRSVVLSTIGPILIWANPIVSYI